MYRVLIVHPDGGVRGAIVAALHSNAGSVAAIQESATIADGLRRARVLRPDVVFMDVATDSALVLRTASELSGAGCLLVGLSSPLAMRNDWVTLQDLIRAGFGDMISVPPDPDDVRSALQAPQRRRTPAPAGHVVAFFAHQGGMGVSTLAVNTAVLLAAAVSKPNHVALCDMVAPFGVVAPFMGIDAPRDLATFVRDLDCGRPVDDCLAVAPATQVSVLASPPSAEDALALGPNEATLVLAELRRRFDWVLVDAPAGLDLLSLSVLDSADRIMVVTDTVSSSISGAARLLDRLGAEGFGADRLRVVVNRYSTFDGHLPEHRLRERLGRPIDHVVPDDRAFVAAANRGRPIAAGPMASPVSAALSSIVAGLTVDRDTVGSGSAR